MNTDLNFFGYFIEGYRNMITMLISSFPTHAPNPFLETLPTFFSQMSIATVFWIVPFFDLTFFMKMMAIIMAMEIVRSFIAVLRWIYGVIPAAS